MITLRQANGDKLIIIMTCHYWPCEFTLTWTMYVRTSTLFDMVGCCFPKLSLLAERPSFTSLVSDDKLDKSTALQVAPLTSIKSQPLLESRRVRFSLFCHLSWSVACWWTSGSLFAHLAHEEYSGLGVFDRLCANFLYTFTYNVLTGDRDLRLFFCHRMTCWSG